MKKLLIACSFIFTTIFCQAQTSTVTATIQDPTTQVFANGTCTIQFVPTPGVPGPFTQGANTFSAGTTVPCSLDGTGSFSVTMTRNDFINPSGSKWQFTVCPNADATCTQVVIAITSAAVNVGSTINAAVPVIAVQAGRSNPRAYQDNEIITVPNAGQQYWNTTNALMRFWNGSSWVSALIAGASPTFTNITITNNESVAGTSTIGTLTVTGNGTVGGTFGVTGLLTGITGAFTTSLRPCRIGNTVFIDDANTCGLSGADIAAVYTSAFALLPAQGGVIDMQGLTTATCGSSICAFSGTWAIDTSTKPVTVYWPALTFNGSPTGGNPAFKVTGSSKLIGVSMGPITGAVSGLTRLNVAVTGSDTIQVTGSGGYFSNIQFNGGNKTKLHLIASATSTEFNKFESVETACGGNAGEIGIELTAATASILNSFETFNHVRTAQCDISFQTDTSNNQGPTDIDINDAWFESTVAQTAAVNIAGANTASIHFSGGHCSGSGPCIVVSSGTNITFDHWRTEGGTDVNDTSGGGNSFTNMSFTNCTTSTFAASDFLTEAGSNVGCHFTLIPNGLQIGGNSGGDGLKIKGATSGSVTDVVPAVAGTNTLTKPAVTGTYLTSSTADPHIQVGINTTPCTTAAALNATCNTTVTLNTGFADTSYKTYCMGNGITSGVPLIQQAAVNNSSSVTAVTIANSAAVAQFANIVCLAIHN